MYIQIQPTKAALKTHVEVRTTSWDSNYLHLGEKKPVSVLMRLNRGQHAACRGGGGQSF